MNDSKLIEVCNFIETSCQNKKVLIFTEFSDTGKYVCEYLNVILKENVGNKFVIESVSGESDNKLDFVRRFSPISNKNLFDEDLTKSNKPDIDILVTTDVLSEGQNLQDASVMINWDLPWAIIKLIQRSGRIDRIGQKNDIITICSFRHGRDLDERLGLYGRLLNRLRENSKILGSDGNHLEEENFEVVDTELRDTYIKFVLKDDQLIDIDDSSKLIVTDLEQAIEESESESDNDVDDITYARRLLDEIENTIPGITQRAQNIGYGIYTANYNRVSKKYGIEYLFDVPSEQLEDIISRFKGYSNHNKESCYNTVHNSDYIITLFEFVGEFIFYIIDAESINIENNKLAYIDIDSFEVSTKDCLDLIRLNLSKITSNTHTNHNILVASEYLKRYDETMRGDIETNFEKKLKKILKSLLGTSKITKSEKTVLEIIISKPSNFINYLSQNNREKLSNLLRDSVGSQLSNQTVVDTIVSIYNSTDFTEIKNHLRLVGSFGIVGSSND